MKALITCTAALALAACASPGSGPVVRSDPGCPRVTACTLPAAAPSTNRHLLQDLERTERAWHECAAQVDAILECQVRADKAGPNE